MYVDSILGKGINENRTTDAISFWDLKNLHKRERLEIEAGKFGMRDYRGLFEEIDREETLDLSNSDSDRIHPNKNSNRFFSVQISDRISDFWNTPRLR
ncbi:hypothetical protein M8C21_018151 [Ambrosia artemisiifolia]|uniref:Uncharacterized protein n=1 Tax=Ambrosia artemisiifolia TaxID=4212 RepID=A0AAD5BNN7_AMBAR|nr:hypothetical protein M8C21_018151 [Ambrosia artemisiifolia]